MLGGWLWFGVWIVLMICVRFVLMGIVVFVRFIFIVWWIWWVIGWDGMMRRFGSVRWFSVFSILGRYCVFCVSFVCSCCVESVV